MDADATNSEEKFLEETMSWVPAKTVSGEGFCQAIALTLSSVWESCSSSKFGSKSNGSRTTGLANSGISGVGVGVS